MKMRVLSFVAVSAFALTGCTGCVSTGSDSKITPYEQGYAVGVAAYLAYERVAKDKDDEFRAKAAKAWEKVEAIQSTETLATDAAEALADFYALEKAAALSDAERQAVRAAASVLLMKLDAAAAGQAEDHPEIVEFLKGARSGVDAYRPKDAPDPEPAPVPVEEK